MSPLAVDAKVARIAASQVAAAMEASLRRMPATPPGQEVPDWDFSEKRDLWEDFLSKVPDNWDLGNEIAEKFKELNSMVPLQHAAVLKDDHWL